MPVGGNLAPRCGYRWTGVLSLAQAGRDDLFRLGVLAVLDMPYDPADDAVGDVLDWDQVGRLELDQEPE